MTGESILSCTIYLLYLRVESWCPVIISWLTGLPFSTTLILEKDNVIRICVTIRSSFRNLSEMGGLFATYSMNHKIHFWLGSDT